ncbi:CMP-N-acetylneuraminate-beta-galactosamide-alpha-2,3-sialyltransferase 1-like [Cottoperca gobio]|uniref:CMP-N-acetylneuraminate-beta-galactosamide- alpha-2,3-sialyltransferase 1-like n=1 Tax=Cottoperca gobio TaxID=56716 RepID=A0A6J2QNP7_COTGO|nr:CMP-N-acetylneuraminate-beta-galactosamide-alpha-2,3-sialyltransferase 1-like [Cottoperca gobio]
MLYRSRGNRALIALLCIAAFALMYISSSSWSSSVYFLGRQSSSLCACDKCLREADLCVGERINESPKPFLSRKYGISEEDYNWWKNIYREGHDFSVYNTTVDKLFQMFPHIADVGESNNKRCTTCAVVGNSGNLKRSHYGPLIDFHDIVIRINYGRTKGYEADVGTKTTHRVMYPESGSYLDNTTSLVLFPYKIKDFLWLIDAFKQGEDSAVNSKRRANKDLVLILNPALMKYVHEIWLGRKGNYPSTGFLTLALSMQICDEVSVFGFGADRDGNWNHYFEVLRNKKLKTGAHAGMHEYEVIQKLHKKKTISFYKGF